MKMEVETGVIQLQVNGTLRIAGSHQKLRERQEWILPQTLHGDNSENALISVFWTPKL